MSKKLLIIWLVLSIIFLSYPRQSSALFDIPDDWGSSSTETREALSVLCTFGVPYLNALGRIVCAIRRALEWLKSFDIFLRIANIVGRVYTYVNRVERIRSYLSYIPQSIPFGGHIESSERACDLHFRSVTWLGIQAGPYWFPGHVYVPVDIPLTGRAIVVGPPLPTYNYGTCNNNVCTSGQTGPCRDDRDCGSAGDGKIISFPWISNIYRNHTEDTVGPWALGLAFTPFPLDEINDELREISIWIPNAPLYGTGDNLACWSWYTQGLMWEEYPKQGFLYECLDDWAFECQSSGATHEGRPIYKVIRKLGTGPR
jgi:hypothetical protein